MWVVEVRPDETDPAVRYRWVLDEDYDVRALWDENDADLRAAMEEEMRQLDAGDLVALGCIAERVCPYCGAWNETDSLWGIVVTSTEDPYCRDVERDMTTDPPEET